MSSLIPPQTTSPVSATKAPTHHIRLCVYWQQYAVYVQSGRYLYYTCIVSTERTVVITVS